MFQKTTSLLSIVATTCLLSFPAQAQEWRADPISFDVRTDTNEQEPLLVVAFTPQDIAPEVARTSNTLTALPPTPDLPSPSMILGRVDVGQEASFGILRLLPTTVSQIGFAHDDLAARRALQTDNPDLFRQLVTEGHVDPPEEIVKAAVQSELARMNCYRSRIDNDWGRGSRQSVVDYFAQREGVDWPEPIASPELFRTIIINPDVECPTPVAAAPVQQRPVQQQRPVRQPTQPATQPAATTPPPPAAEPSGPQLNIGGSTGVFR